MSFQEQFDVVVMGGGPAGGTVASLLAEAGRSVLVVERRDAEDFKIGESLMPATYGTLARLGVLDRLKASHFPKKYSVQFFTKNGKASAPFYFNQTDPTESSQTWQVLRSEFDQMILERASECGAEVRRRLRVRDVLFDGDRAAGVRLQKQDGETYDVAAKVVVDATGQRAFLARKLGILEIDSHLKNASIYSHFEGAYRDTGIDEGATLILHTEEADSWFWYIPLPGDRVSVGVVGEVEYLITSREGSPTDIFFEEVEKCAEIKKRLLGARQSREMNVLRDFSYRAKSIAGHGWVLLGDAYTFIDPVYSSGILLALKMGEVGAEAIDAALGEDDLSAARLGSFESQLAGGMTSIRSLVNAFYSREFSFGKFLREYPEHQGDIVDILVGNVFDRDFELLFGRMKEMFASLELPDVAVAGSRG